MILVRTAAAPPFRMPCPPPRPPFQFWPDYYRNPCICNRWPFSSARGSGARVQIRTVGKKIAPNCPTDPTNFGLQSCFQVPTDSQGLWGDHEQYLSDPWEPGHAVLCVWKPERRSFTHSRSHARSLKVRFFRSQSESSRPYMWGVGLTQQIA
jgi:hypothetical protein